MVSTAAARRELEDLRSAINYHRREGLCSEIVSVVLPERSAGARALAYQEGGGAALAGGLACDGGSAAGRAPPGAMRAACGALILTGFTPERARQPFVEQR